MNTNRKCFMFFESFYYAINAISDKDLKIKLYEAIMRKGLFNEDVETNEPVVMAMFELVKPIIENTEYRYNEAIKNGKKGGAPKGNKNACKKTTQNNLKTTQNNLKEKGEREEEKEEEKEKEVKKEYDEREESSSGGQNATPKISLTRNKLNSNELDVDSCELKSSLSNEDLEKFKEVFPNKLTEGKYTVPSNFEMDKLISEVKESDFLKSNNNLSLPWLINNYDKIINGAYKDYVKKNENTIVTHNYTTEELNSFFTDLDSLDL